jgi:hypothetical protein
LMTKHFTILQLKKNQNFLSKIASLGIYEERPSCRRSLQPSKELPALKTQYISSLFPPIFVGHFCLYLDPDPDPADQNQ